MKNKTAFLPIRVSVFNCGFPNEQIRFGKAIYLLPVPIGSLLFVLLASTLGGSAHGWWHAPMLLSNGSLGCCPPQAWHTEIARDPAPCPLPGLMKNRQVDMTKINSLLQSYVLDTNDWPLLYYDFIETCSFLQWPLPLLNKETVQEMVRTARRIGLIKSPQVVICEKKVFLFLKLLLWKISH